MKQRDRSTLNAFLAKWPHSEYLQVFVQSNIISRTVHAHSVESPSSYKHICQLSMLLRDIAYQRLYGA